MQKKRKMKKSSLILLLGLMVLNSCISTEYWKMRIEIPRQTELDIEAFDSVIIAPFLVEAEIEEFDLSKEISDFFLGMLKRKTKNSISTTDVSVENETQFEAVDFWKNQARDSEKTLFLSGTAQYSSEVRKALVKRAKKRYEDPFPTEDRLEQQKFYTLNLSLYFIDAQSGEAVFKREFKETKSYSNPNQTDYFAFFDLVQQVQEKLLRSVLGLEQIQERYLVIK